MSFILVQIQYFGIKSPTKENIEKELIKTKILKPNVNKHIYFPRKMAQKNIGFVKFWLVAFGSTL